MKPQESNQPSSTQSSGTQTNYYYYTQNLGQATDQEVAERLERTLKATHQAATQAIESAAHTANAKD